MILGVARTKLIIFFLGTAGVGLLGIYQSIISFFESIFSFGVSTAATRLISIYKSENNIFEVRRIGMATLLILFILGILCSFVLFFSSYGLSKISFGDLRFASNIKIIGLVVCLNLLISGSVAIFQGVYEPAKMVKSNLLGSLVGVLLAFPILYFLKEDGLVPSLLVTSISTFLFSLHFIFELNLNPKWHSVGYTLNSASRILSTGIFISIGNSFVFFIGYLIRVYIGKTSNIQDVAYYSASFTILNMYMGTLFNAMSGDYYPRLTYVIKDLNERNNLINKQAEIILIFIGPILSIFVLFNKTIIYALFSSDFLVINGLLIYSVLGILFKAFSWCIAYSFLAHSNSKLFMINEIVSSLILLVFSIIGFKLFYLNGLAYAYIISYLLYFIQVYIIAQNRYFYKASRAVILTFSFVLFGLVFLILSAFISNSVIKVFLEILILFSFLIFSFVRLKRKIDFVSYFKRK
jgi:O-antigen/teichoic acid export membrane protein